MTLDIQAERISLQEMYDNPKGDIERDIKAKILDNGSQPHEWSDETVSSAHYMIRVFAMGWYARDARK